MYDLKKYLNKEVLVEIRVNRNTISRHHFRILKINKDTVLISYPSNDNHKIEKYRNYKEEIPRKELENAESIKVNKKIDSPKKRTF